MSDREFTEEDLEHERSHLRSVLTAFLYYKRHALARNQRRRRDYMALSEHHKKLVPDLPAKFDAVDRCVEENMKLLKDVVICAGAFMGLDPLALMAEQYRNQKDRQHPPASPMDMDKVRSTLKQFVRDWSAEGKPERDATYGPIRDELEEMYKDVPIEKRGQIRVLVPGAGLGRLAFDIASQGFSCQGNEYSFYMLLPSNFVLNKMEKEEQYEIYPFIHSYSNIQSSQKQLEPIRIPDVLPSNLPSTCDFSMAAGEFVEVYGEDENNKGAWDVVVTCFFIDTAKNILEYIEVIHGVLKDGGTWINIGPLLYHYEDMPGESSIELDLEQVKRISQAMGFEFEKEKMIQTTYTSNPDSMLQYMYNCAFWKATKKPANKEKE